MKICISTIAIDSYLVLVPLFINSIRLWKSDLPIYVFVKEEELNNAENFIQSSKCSENVKCIGISTIENLNNDNSTQGCAIKLMIWNYLPLDVTHTIFLDVDTIVIGDLFTDLMKIKKTSEKMLLARDSYVGFKESMGEEFKLFGREWKPKFDESGKRKYCNTGLIFCSRHDSVFFQMVLNEWRRFVKMFKANPSIWDQNIFNYCLDVAAFGKTWDDIIILDENYNTLKEYEIFIDLDNSSITLSNKNVMLVHFNGGDILTKYARRSKSIQLMFK